MSATLQDEKRMLEMNARRLEIIQRMPSCVACFTRSNKLPHTCGRDSVEVMIQKRAFL